MTGTCRAAMSGLTTAVCFDNAVETVEAAIETSISSATLGSMLIPEHHGDRFARGSTPPPPRSQPLPTGNSVLAALKRDTPGALGELGGRR